MSVILVVVSFDVVVGDRLIGMELPVRNFDVLKLSRGLSSPALSISPSPSSSSSYPSEKVDPTNELLGVDERVLEVRESFGTSFEAQVA